MKLEQKYLDHIYSSIGGKIEGVGFSVQEAIVKKIEKSYKRLGHKLKDKGTLNIESMTEEAATVTIFNCQILTVKKKVNKNV